MEVDRFMYLLMYMAMNATMGVEKKILSMGEGG